MNKIYFLFLYILLFNSVCSQSKYTYSKEHYPQFERELGSGFEPNVYEIRDTPFESYEIVEDKRIEKSEVEFFLSTNSINSSEVFDIDLDIEVSSLFASGKNSFHNSSSTNNTSNTFYLTILCKRFYVGKFIDNPILKQTLTTLCDKEKHSKLIESYGTEFVFSEKPYSVFKLVVSIGSSSLSTSSELKNKLNASGGIGVYSGDIAIDIKRTLSEVLKTSSVSISSESEGLSPESGNKLNSFIDQIKSDPSKLVDGKLISEILNSSNYSDAVPYGYGVKSLKKYCPSLAKKNIEEIYRVNKNIQLMQNYILADKYLVNLNRFLASQKKYKLKVSTNIIELAKKDTRSFKKYLIELKKIYKSCIGNCNFDDSCCEIPDIPTQSYLDEISNFEIVIDTCRKMKENNRHQQDAYYEVSGLLVSSVDLFIGKYFIRNITDNLVISNKPFGIFYSDEFYTPVHRYIINDLINTNIKTYGKETAFLKIWDIYGRDFDIPIATISWRKDPDGSTPLIEYPFVYNCK